MAVLSLPLSFNNSFWTQDYRKGLEILFKKLEQGVAENSEIIGFIRARATAEAQLAIRLTNPALTGASATGFSVDDGASLLMAFRGLQAESVVQGQAHKTIAKELDTLVADPFDEWAQGYSERIWQNKSLLMDNLLKSYENAQTEVSKLKQQYLTKTRRADEAEDDAKFAPNSGGGVPDKYTTSPRIRPLEGRASPARTASVSERISQRLKEIQKKSTDAIQSALTDNAGEEVTEKEATPPPKLDKGKGKAVDEDQLPPSVTASPPPLSPPLPPRAELPPPPSSQQPQPAPILLSGIAFPSSAVSQLISRAAAELPLRPVRFPLLGEYQGCFTGDEFVSWLQSNVAGFEGNLDRAEEAAKALTEREGLLRRIGEIGNLFEDADDAFYQFRPKAFDLGHKNVEHTGITSSVSTKSLQPENLIKRTGNFVNLVSKVLNNPGSGEPPYMKARHEAEEADQTYRVSIRKLDRQRLALEERIEEALKLLQRWEAERLRAVKTVLLQYQGTLANLPKSLEPSIDRQATLVASYQPENDLTALIERYRTGPFRPNAHVYESVAHDEADVVFGIDLRKWAEGGWAELAGEEEKKKGLVPNVLTALLEGVSEAYKRLPDDSERRKSWIYEVPLPAVHHLREALNAVPPDQPIPVELVAKYDAPVIASALKLWILELDPPLALYEGWDDLRKLYPTVGSVAKAEEDKSQEDHISAIGAALQKLPRVHLYVLDAVVKHLKTLFESTTVEEPDEVYITKLALSIGRAVVRPKVETELSIQDRHPTLVFIDLLKNYDAILPPTIARKKRESERRVPIRKRTAPIDMRLSRSRISVGADAKQLLAAQQLAQNPSLNKSPTRSPELPPPLPIGAVTSQSPPLQARPVTAPSAPGTIVPPPPPPATVVPPPPPSTRAPPTAAEVQAYTAAPPPPAPAASQPGRPMFKEPPPELDDEPPRPMFKEPPPELEPDSSRPDFASPPPEDPSPPPAKSPLAKPASPPATAIIPPTPPQKRSAAGQGSTASPSSPLSNASSAKIASRSPSPPEDVTLGTGRATLGRAGSGQSAPLRGPRRGPRTPTSGSVSNLVQNINRNSVSGSPPQSSPIGARSANRLSGSPVRKSSVLGRSPAFSRRTMASDAEDDVVDRK